MTFLQKKLFVKFSVILIVSLLLAWRNGRPVSVKNPDQKILGKACNSKLILSEVLNEHLKLADSDDFKKLKLMLQSDSLSAFSDNVKLNELMLKYDIQGLFTYDRFNNSNDKYSSELNAIIELLISGDFQNKLVEIGGNNPWLQPDYNTLCMLLLNRANHFWGLDRKYSIKCLNGARSLIGFLSKNSLRGTLENAALLNCIYHLSIFYIINEKGAEIVDVLELVSLTSSKPFSVNTKDFLTVSRAKLKYEIFKLMRNPEVSVFEPSIKNNLKTFSWDIKKTFGEIDGLYSFISSEIKNKNWVEKLNSAMVEGFHPPAGGAFSFLTRNVEDKREFNNWLLGRLVRFMLSDDVNSYQNILQIGTNLDLLTNSLLKLYAVNKESKKIDIDVLSKLNEPDFITVETKGDKLIMEIKFNFNANDGFFLKIPKRLVLQIPVELGI